MGNLSWKIRSLLEKAKPGLILLAVLWGTWSLYSHGIFRRGIWPAVSSTLHHVPVFGSHFRHWRGQGESKSFAYSGRSYRRHRGYSHRRHGHHGRHHRRHRRHR